MIQPPYPKDIASLIVKIISQLSIKAYRNSDTNNELPQFLGIP